MRCTLIYSGGSDSFTLLHWLRTNGYEVDAISVAYGQRHWREINCASTVAHELSVPHQIIDIPLDTIVVSSALTSRSAPVPEGHYAGENMKQTVVPNRNMVLLALAASYALSRGSTHLAYGTHHGDHEIYPDCRAEFVDAMRKAFRLCDWRSLELITPFLQWDKRLIYAWGTQHGLDYAKTWTCYNGRPNACGRCGSCVERLEAFDLIGKVDPLDYEDREFYKRALDAKHVA